MCVFCFFSSCTLNLFPSQVLQDCMRHHGSIVEIGKLWVSLSITVVLIYLCSYVCPIRTEEASSFNCAHQTLCLLLSRSGPPPWPIWTARVHLFQAAVHKNGISRKGMPLLCHMSQDRVCFLDVKIWRLQTFYFLTINPYSTNIMFLFSTKKSHQTWRSQMKFWSALQELTSIMCEFPHFMSSLWLLLL